MSALDLSAVEALALVHLAACTLAVIWNTEARKVGGIWFVRCGALGGSFYVSRRARRTSPGMVPQ